MPEKKLYSAVFEDMEVSYWLSEDGGTVGLQLNPAGWEERRQEKTQAVESLVQLRLRGDDAPFGYANGHTMRRGATQDRFRFAGQEVRRDGGQTEIVTSLASEDGLAIAHHLTYHAGERGVEVYAAFANNGPLPVTLEMLSSFSLFGLTPFIEGDAPGSLVLHRLRSKWSNEGRLTSESIEDLQLEPTWARHGVASERYGQVGSLPVRRFFPFAAVEDRVNGVFWGAQLHAPASWQIEVYRKDDGLSLSGGLADYDFGHWAKEIGPGESFETPVANLSACTGDLDALCDRLTRMQKRPLNELPRPERLPVVFNEYCTTWGEPSQRRLEEMLEALKGHDFDTFVIDCGWYAQDGRSWELNMGDWRVNGRLFPRGLGTAARAIRDAGMSPGLWFEPEICGRESDAFHAHEAHLLKRFGEPVTAGVRRFWDMRDPWARAYLREKVIETLAQNGFEYIKIDCNETIGIGCDGAESPGEGLRQTIAASQDFFREIRRRIPNIVIENCASGGHRLEPSFLGICQLASATDAHEVRELAIIAANLHRVMLPEQSLIWAVLREGDSPRRLVWSVATTFLGVMCLSGDVERLSPRQWDIVDRGIAFYRAAAGIIQDGVSARRGPRIESYRHPRGWQAVERTALDGGRKLIVVHVFEGSPEVLRLPVAGSWTVGGVFAEAPEAIRFSDGVLSAKVDADSAFAVLLKKE